MSIMYAEACISEKGTINGTKGDQTGKEVKISKPYTHSLGWRCFYYPTTAVAQKISIYAAAIANNNCFGYGQSDRVTGYNATKAAGWNPAAVKTNVNIDCSELVRTAVACALGKEVKDFYTATEPSVLLSLGFKETSFNINSLKPGMILCTRSKGHTCVVIDTALTSASTASAATKSTTTTTSSAGNVHAYYQVIANGKNYSEVCDYNTSNGNGYAGVEGQKITDLALRVSAGSVKYRVHVLGGQWLPWVTGYNWKDANNGYAGNHKPIDAIQIVYSGSGKRAMYRVSTTATSSYLPWVYNDADYAGTYGKPIDKIQIAIV